MINITKRNKLRKPALFKADKTEDSELFEFSGGSFFGMKKIQLQN